jgi:hypothetical protein
MLSNGSGSVHHHSESLVDKLIGRGLLAETDRDDHHAVDAALDKLLVEVPTGAPMIDFYATEQVKLASLMYLVMADLEVEVALGRATAQELAAKFIRARTLAHKAGAPVSVQLILTHLAESIRWGLQPLGETIDVQAIAAHQVR